MLMRPPELGLGEWFNCRELGPGLGDCEPFAVNVKALGSSIDCLKDDPRLRD